jgi:hypothetical protein
MYRIHDTTGGLNLPLTLSIVRVGQVRKPKSIGVFRDMLIRIPGIVVTTHFLEPTSMHDKCEGPTTLDLIYITIHQRFPFQWSICSPFHCPG